MSFVLRHLPIIISSKSISEFIFHLMINDEENDEEIDSRTNGPDISIHNDTRVRDSRTELRQFPAIVESPGLQTTRDDSILFEIVATYMGQRSSLGP